MAISKFCLDRKMWIFWLFSIFSAINCFEFSSPNLKVEDQCDKLCEKEKLPTLEPVNFENFVCQTGCQFFNIMRYGGGLDAPESSPSIEQCHTFCKESYVLPEESDICSIGCGLTASKSQKYLLNILIITQQERSRSENSQVESDNELLETYFLSDPSIRSQLEVGFNVDYKIPETHIRTMPIEDSNQLATVVQIKPKDSGDWLDCAAKNSGIPRWILLAMMTGAVLVALWLTLTMETRKGHDEGDDDEMLIETDGKLAHNYIIEKDVFLLDNGAFNVASDEEILNVKFSPPPKYSEVNELTGSEVANSNELVENGKIEENA